MKYRMYLARNQDNDYHKLIIIQFKGKYKCLLKKRKFHQMNMKAFSDSKT